MTTEEMDTYVRQIERQVNRLSDEMGVVVVEVPPAFYPRVYWKVVAEQPEKFLAEVQPTNTIGETNLMLKVLVGDRWLRIVPHSDAEWSRLVCRKKAGDLVYLSL
jgi:hypothetical protein